MRTIVLQSFRHKLTAARIQNGQGYALIVKELALQIS